MMQYPVPSDELFFWSIARCDASRNSKIDSGVAGTKRGAKQAGPDTKRGAKQAGPTRLGEASNDAANDATRN
ncbi:hypothetical protein A2U01_0003476 [Trifolium medium]|uniref:Uncharacterized protein n=1 Tax=Trifolium medium TaxID=97028 RepID=A0A392M5Q8_9FABA|nr:hypothetical protein [Trifolium medium]